MLPSMEQTGQGPKIEDIIAQMANKAGMTMQDLNMMIAKLKSRTRQGVEGAAQNMYNAGGAAYRGAGAVGQGFQNLKAGMGLPIEHVHKIQKDHPFIKHTSKLREDVLLPILMDPANYKI